MELFLSSPETHMSKQQTQCCTVKCMWECVSLRACHWSHADHLLMAQPLQCNPESKWTHSASSTLCNFSPTAQNPKHSFCCKRSCRDCYAAQVDPKNSEKEQRVDIKTAGNLKNSPLLDYNTITEGARERINKQKQQAAACIIPLMILWNHIQYKWTQFACKSKQSVKGSNQISYGGFKMRASKTMNFMCVCLCIIITN